MLPDNALQLKEILEHYDLGELANLEKNERGYVNTSFAIQTIQGGQRRQYFLRKYKAGIREPEIQFEHSLINHLVALGAPPVARLHRTRDGDTYVRQIGEADDRERVFFAIFDFLPGEDCYTWVGPRCSKEQLQNSAVVLAQFHNAVSGFQPQGQRAEAKIFDLLPLIAAGVAACPARAKNTVFDAYLLERLHLVLQNIAATRAVLSEPEVLALPQLIIHCDYHPGNLRFRGSQVTGLFDFDWSKIDARCFDVALALWYFCTNWEAPQDGAPDGAPSGGLRLAEVQTFLSAYQATLHTHPGAGPLGPMEGKYLPYMINASNLYILNWTIEDYYRKDVDPQEYLVYLRHGLNFMDWFETDGHLDELKAILSPLIDPEG